MYLPRRLSRSVVQRANLVCLVIAVLVMCRVTHGGPVPDTLPGPVLSPEPARFHDDHTFFHRPGHLRYNPRRRRDSNETSTKRSVRNAHDEPKFLTSKTGYTLVVTQDGTVRGVRQVRPKDGEIWIKIAENRGPSPGTLIPESVLQQQGNPPTYSLKAKHARRYICIDRTGKCYSSSKLEDDCRFFVNKLRNHYDTYCSATYAGSRRHPNPNKTRKWCIGINKKGTIHGRTKNESNNAQFQARPVNSGLDTPLPPHVQEETKRKQPVSMGDDRPTSSSNLQDFDFEKESLPKREKKTKPRKNKKKKKTCPSGSTLFSVSSCRTKQRQRGYRRRLPKQYRRRKSQTQRPLSSKSTFFQT